MAGWTHPTVAELDCWSELRAYPVAVASRVRSVTTCSSLVPSSGVEHPPARRGCPGGAGHGKRLMRICQYGIATDPHARCDEGWPTVDEVQVAAAERIRNADTASAGGAAPAKRNHATQPIRLADRRALRRKPLVTDGAPSGTRTPNPLIKSQLLCQLS